MEGERGAAAREEFWLSTAAQGAQQHDPIAGGSQVDRAASGMDLPSGAGLGAATALTWARMRCVTSRRSTWASHAGFCRRGEA